MKLLIADDEKITREYIKYVIEENTVDSIIMEASNGREVIELAQSFQPDLILLDIRMPEIDGLTAAKKIKDEMPWINIVILTASDQFKYAQTAVKIHVQDYLLKPISPSNLMETITDVLRQENSVKTDANGFHDVIQLERNLMEALIQGDEKESIQSFEDILEGIINANYSVEDFRKYIIELTGVVTRRLIANRLSDSSLNELKSEFQSSVMKLENLNLIGEETIRFIRDVFKYNRNYYLTPIEINIEKSKRYVAYHYQNKILLSDVATYIGYSESYFSRIFKKITQKNFSDYLNEYRLEKSKQLMTNNHLTLAEIATRVGFENFSYFSSVFHKYEGIVPSEYRKK